MLKQIVGKNSCCDKNTFYQLLSIVELILNLRTPIKHVY